MMGYNPYHRMLKNQVPGEDQQKLQWKFQYYSFGDEPMMLFMFFLYMFHCGKSQRSWCFSSRYFRPVISGFYMAYIYIQSHPGVYRQNMMNMDMSLTCLSKNHSQNRKICLNIIENPKYSIYLKGYCCLYIYSIYIYALYKALTIMAMHWGIGFVISHV